MHNIVPVQNLWLASKLELFNLLALTMMVPLAKTECRAQKLSSTIQKIHFFPDIALELVHIGSPCLEKTASRKALPHTERCEAVRRNRRRPRRGIVASVPKLSANGLEPTGQRGGRLPTGHPKTRNSPWGSWPYDQEQGSLLGTWFLFLRTLQ